MEYKVNTYENTQSLDLSLPLEQHDRLYKGLPFHIWKGLLVGTITGFILNNTAGFLMLGFMT